MMITTPEMTASLALYIASNWPTEVEIAPSETKTMLNPMMKAIELSITFLSKPEFCSCNCSTPAPEISDTYPGTSGKTQGERNEITPAKKAAIGNGRLDIERSYCIRAA